MEFIKLWLISITGTTLFLAMTDSIMPSGSVKQVGRLLSGLILLVMILKPFLQLSPESIASLSNHWQESILQEQEQQKNYYNNQLQSVIEENLEAYIMDKAMEIGVFCEASVQCNLGEDGIFIPTSIQLETDSAETWTQVETLVQEELGITPTKGGIS